MITTRRLPSLALALGLGLVTACGGDDEEEEVPATQEFDGTWVACRNDEGFDYREVFTISGNAVVVDLLGYDTDDATCDGDATEIGSDTLTAAYGGTVTADSVQATMVDLDLGTEVFYTLVYRDEAANPDALHLGLDDAQYDGSTPALRPIHLQELPRALQATPVPADLTGNWAYCPAGEEGGVLSLDAATGAFDLVFYPAGCAGTVTEHLEGTFTLASPVYATLGYLTVTAFALDVTTGIGTFYMTVYVDREASPRRLVHGNDGLHGMNGSSPALRPRVLSDEAFVRQ